MNLGSPIAAKLMLYSFVLDRDLFLGQHKVSNFLKGNDYEYKNLISTVHSARIFILRK